MERSLFGAFPTQQPKKRTNRLLGTGALSHSACPVTPALLCLVHMEVYPQQQYPAVRQLQAQSYKEGSPWERAL